MKRDTLLRRKLHCDVAAEAQNNTYIGLKIDRTKERGILREYPKGELVRLSY